MKILFVSLLILALPTLPTDANGTILVVLAHPDDETALGAVLRKYSRTNQVHLLVATDGRYGQPENPVPVDVLIKMREQETRCGCQALGLESPVFLGFTDGFDSRDGTSRYQQMSGQLKSRIKERIEKLDPDFILTFGPEGDTGHSDHRMISNMVTEVILSSGWVERYPLYYLGWIEKDNEKFQMLGGVNTVHPDYLNVAIRFSQEDEDEALESVWCYESQYSKDVIAEWIAAEKADTTNTLHFRQLTVPSNHRDRFLAE